MEVESLHHTTLHTLHTLPALAALHAVLMSLPVCRTPFFAAACTVGHAIDYIKEHMGG